MTHARTPDDFAPPELEAPPADAVDDRPHFKRRRRAKAAAQPAGEPAATQPAASPAGDQWGFEDDEEPAFSQWKLGLVLVLSLLAGFAVVSWKKFDSLKAMAAERVERLTGDHVATDDVATDDVATDDVAGDRASGDVPTAASIVDSLSPEDLSPMADFESHEAATPRVPDALAADRFAADPFAAEPFAGPEPVASQTSDHSTIAAAGWSTADDTVLPRQTGSQSPSATQDEPRFDLPPAQDAGAVDALAGADPFVLDLADAPAAEPVPQTGWDDPAAIPEDLVAALDQPIDDQTLDDPPLVDQTLDDPLGDDPFAMEMAPVRGDAPMAEDPFADLPPQFDAPPATGRPATGRPAAGGPAAESPATGSPVAAGAEAADGFEPPAGADPFGGGRSDSDPLDVAGDPFATPVSRPAEEMSSSDDLFGPGPEQPVGPDPLNSTVTAKELPAGDAAGPFDGTFAPTSTAVTGEPQAAGPRRSLPPSEVPAARPAPAADPLLPQRVDIAADTRTHLVEGGENFWSISKSKYGSPRYFAALAEWNRSVVPDANALRPGTRIELPPADVLEPLVRTATVAAASTPVPIEVPPAARRDATHVLRSGETYWSISKAHYGTVRYFAALAEWNRRTLGDASKLRPGATIELPAAAKLDPLLKSPAFPADVAGSGLPNADEGAAGYFETADGQPRYRVGPSDTLTGIAQSTLGRASRWRQIYAMNRDRLRSPDVLPRDAVLSLPADAVRVASAR